MPRFSTFTRERLIVKNNLISMFVVYNSAGNILVKFYCFCCRYVEWPCFLNSLGTIKSQFGTNK